MAVFIYLVFRKCSKLTQELLCFPISWKKLLKEKIPNFRDILLTFLNHFLDNTIKKKTFLIPLLKKNKKTEDKIKS